jgi:peptide-methionine (S)-S-oxide reductase
MKQTPHSNPVLSRILAPLATLAVVGSIAAMALSAKVPPAPVQAEAATPTKGMAVATLSGGCFWSMEAIYSRLNGVKSAEPGYAGGTTPNPTYEQVCGEQTGHAETVNVTYDPKVISYGELVEVLLTVLDPTTVDRQGADVGSSYRSVIFYRTPAEKKVAQETINKINYKGIWPNPIVTQVAPLKKFYPAEAYHRNYYNLHSEQGYCRAVIVPKLDKLRQKFSPKLKPNA